jgi:aspartyl-tRNA(Asn)/glutamyl-tRNA(Gln) amidotransferase subunit B
MDSLLRNKYEAVIGIECHVQLATKSKLFCGCDNDSREAEPNRHICPVCMGMPGTLPVLNQRAVELAIRLGLALNAEIGRHTKFDRKNYFYPDSPKGYQITQYDRPIVGLGAIEFPLAERIVKIGITRAHLEGDAGKLTHPEGSDTSLVDLNRAETPLVEIVSEPDMRSATEAKAYAQELYNIVRYAGVSDANLYYGNMRFDVNVSVRLVGAEEFGTRTETKNLNSFRAIEQTVEHEIRRQIAVVDGGGKIRQETRGWNELKGETYPMRSKEDADEYRYFPEPDLPPLVISDKMIDQAQSELGLLPNALRVELAKAMIPKREAEVVVGEPELAHFWNETYRLQLNWLVGDQVRISSDRSEALGGSKLTPSRLVEVGKMVKDGKLSSTNAKNLLEKLWDEEVEPEVLAEQLGLVQESDSGHLAKVVETVMAEQPQAVEDLQAGNMRAMGALVGAAMKATRGQGNPRLITELIQERLKK